MCADLAMKSRCEMYRNRIGKVAKGESTKPRECWPCVCVGALKLVRGGGEWVRIE